MSKHTVPSFEVNGKKYEIKRNRYIMAELDELKSEIKLTDEEEVAYAKEQDFDNRLNKLHARKEELYDKYIETFAEEDRELYEKADKAYQSMIEQSVNMESIASIQRKKMLDIGETLVIKALMKDDEGKEIRTYEECKEIWEQFVEESGQIIAIHFVVYFINYIMGGDEDIENPFIAQAKAKAEQKASMKKGIEKAK